VRSDTTPQEAYVLRVSLFMRRSGRNAERSWCLTGVCRKPSSIASNWKLNWPEPWIVMSWLSTTSPSFVSATGCSPGRSSCQMAASPVRAARTGPLHTPRGGYRAIVNIGRWVLRQACEQLRSWQTTHPSADGLTISVNLSPGQLSDRNSPPTFPRPSRIRDQP